MINTIVKRSGQSTKFDSNKISVAIFKANKDKTTNYLAEIMTDQDIQDTVKLIIEQLHDNITVEEIQDIVENTLMKQGFYNTARSYIIYRRKHQEQREATEKLMLQYYDILSAQDSDDKRENANIDNDTPAAIMHRLGSTGAKIFADNYGIPEEFVKAEQEGWLHYHKQIVALDSDI